MPPTAPYYFMSYSRDDVNLQKTIIAGLRQRNVKAWVDIENLIPGSPAWEREIERAIRGASGVIVLLSPDANNSEWVRREISFAEQNEKRIFPVLIHGDEDDSIPLRLSNHQRVDLRRHFSDGLDSLADALREHLGETAVQRLPEQTKSSSFDPRSLQKYVLPGVLALIGFACLGGLTFAASYIYNSFSQPTSVITTPPDVDPVNTLTPAPDITATPIEIVDHGDEPSGKIVYTCQIAGDEICIINADGSGWQQLTNTAQANFNAFLSPDGNSVIYVAAEGEKSEIYEMNLSNGDTRRLTDLGEFVSTPEISPDNQFIIFTYRKGNNNRQIWIMDRNGTNPQTLYASSNKDAHDATWSPDSTRILFAFGRGDNNQLYIMDNNGRDPQLVNDSIDTRGHSSWSITNLISLDMGGSFMHDIYVMNGDGSNLHRISQEGKNAQGESFSPDGEWIAYTAYTDVANQDQNSCEIHIMRVDGTNITRLTDNHYCDSQPRWGK